MNEVQVEASLLIEVLQQELNAVNSKLYMQMAIVRQLQADKLALQERLAGQVDEPA